MSNHHNEQPLLAGDLEASVAPIRTLERNRTGRTLWRLARAKARGTTIGITNDVSADKFTGVHGLMQHEGYETGPVSTPGTRTNSLPMGSDYASLSRNTSLLRQLSMPLMLSEPGPNTPGFFDPISDLKHIGRAIATSWMSLLLIAVPFGIWGGLNSWDATTVFVLNFFSLVPLALMLGGVTEDLALRFGDTVGGLLNATFGNAVELVLSIAALNKGLYTVVATSLIGSILSNLLLVLGCCFLFGGVYFPEQSFNPQANKASCSLLFLAAIAITVPTAATHMFPTGLSTDAMLHISHGTCIMLVIVYCAYLYFQLRSHADLFQGEESEDDPSMSLLGALVLLATITGIVAVCSEFLTGAIEAVSETSGLSQEFLGLIVLPIAGNACEHITAVFVAIKNKCDLALGVALGSSIQIAIFVLPAVVLIGWLPMVNRPMTLLFSPFGVFVLMLSVVHAFFVSSDGRSNWLLGLQLVSTYVLIAVVYYFVP